MTAKSKARESRSRKPDSSTDIEKRILQRAYELYEQRGRLTDLPWITGFELKQTFAERRNRPPRRNRVGDENLAVDRGVLWAT
jgi:hypothetical protein